LHGAQLSLRPVTLALAGLLAVAVLTVAIALAAGRGEA
jgi:hypothetical protein